ncbi:hypothetical protein LPJ53_004457 [Coemansia erecta]|uniref:Uncharacterized protein n=1 Tax=Coemansia erecta TaxID=147472 RepID=A0A9W8CRB3_9FUNG|nr:hypothetical protein LPJ53_004457 [Coemansia erecta]
MGTTGKHPKPTEAQNIVQKRQKMGDSTSATSGCQDTRQHQQQQQRAVFESCSPTERLLAQSPSYMTNCELYPRVMRDTINQHTEEAVSTRDPRVTREAEQCYQDELERQRQFSKAHPEEALSFYPAAARSGSSL